MAFRKFRRSFRRSFPRRRRGVRTITEPRRWELATFDFRWTIAPGEGLSDGVALDLLSQAHFDNFGLDTEVRGLADALRTVEIGGIVWDTLFLQTFNSETFSSVLPFQEILWTDRVDNAGSPISATTADWWNTQAPVDPAGLSDGDFPVRVHARRATSLFFPGTSAFTGGVAIDTRFSTAPLQPRSWSTRSVRIKGGLGDRQGLFLQLTLRNAADLTGCQLNGETVGSLYYRARM